MPPPRLFLSRKPAPGLLALALLALFSVACGGGGGDSGPTAPEAASVTEIEYNSYQLANRARSDNNVQPQLGLEQVIAAVARAHSEAMRDQGFFAHNGPDGGLKQRLKAAGVPFSAAAENLARLDRVGDPAGVAHSEFMASSTHRKNLLNSSFQLVGVGVARAGDSYWLTQIFIEP